MIRKFVCYTRVVATSICLMAMIFVVVPSGAAFLKARNSVQSYKLRKRTYLELVDRKEQLNQDQQTLQRDLLQMASRTALGDGAKQTRELIAAIVRDAKCHLRSINIEQQSDRDWYGQDDDPLARTNDLVDGMGAGLRLVISRVSLIVTGDNKVLHNLVELIEKERFLAVPEYFVVAPVDESGVVLQLELHLKFFGLTPDDSEDFLDLEAELLATR